MDDKTFVANFSWIIVGLVIFTFFIAYLASEMDTNPIPDNPTALAATEERLQPIASAYTSADQLPEPASAAASAPAPAAPAAVDDSMAQDDGAEAGGDDAAATQVAMVDGHDGGQIYQQVCAACHVAGVANAPIPGSELWEERAAKGLDEMVYNAVNGIGAMPAKGGRVDLPDEAIRAAVVWMDEQPAP